MAASDTFQNAVVRAPFGVVAPIAVAYATAPTVTINNSETYITVAQLTGAMTLNFTVDAETRLGDKVWVEVSVDSTGRTITFGTGITAVAQAIAASKTYLFGFVWNGTTFMKFSGTIAN